VFHMWADGQGKQLWVNNDGDYTTSVIDLTNNTVVETINLGIKPHDVFVNKAGTMAYISIFSGDPSIADSIFAYSTSSFQRVAAAGVGKDPHVFHLSSRNKLYVPCQSGTVYILDGDNLSQSKTIPVDGSHGIYIANDNQYVYVADIVDKRLVTINPTSEVTVGTPLITTDDKPHNLTVNESKSKTIIGS